ncbi:hypothetical protein KAFR_0G03360 [Kazachstania africana CBS 2517]|uniref:Protein LOT5 n=1 Tax=Kazachstania africana (strain ATCC 22294 / BCRC 22015 / CBS 2517 / CECT 1963 / NBRC 1671 / NRRL Y-8276) TaxID=1071382 RepID=H2AYB8_KAZAF|nr:hypothetical protein KAFR_0G03360 [Kazachstania africana CBS 2517]CCF59368.1 hypothetical protein KAFR_0G03360 [Kazachstania africana CBS 2517]
MKTPRATCDIATIKPTVENVIAYVEYKKTQPRLISGLQGNEHDVLLLGGGRDLILSLLTGNESQKLENVELFILNTNVILWFNILGHGLQIPYSSILYHGSRSLTNENEGHRLEVLLTLEVDPTLSQFFPHENFEANTNVMKSVEITLRPKYSMYDRHYNSEIENLFTFMNFGTNRGDELVKNCNNALAMAMELHSNDDDEEDEDENEDMQGIDDDNAVFTGLSEILKNQNATFQNIGSADDLDGDSFMNQLITRDETDAGMSLEFYTNQNITGQKHFRNT